MENQIAGRNVATVSAVAAQKYLTGLRQEHSQSSTSEELLSAIQDIKPLVSKCKVSEPAQWFQLFKWYVFFYSDIHFTS